MNLASRNRAVIATAVALTVSLATVAPVRAAVRSFGKNYQLTATMKGAQNMTVLLVSAKGQTLASAAVTKSNQKVTLKASGVASTKGATIQLVSGKSASGKGAYYGPVVIGWQGKKSAAASKVTTKMKASASTKIALGTVQVKSASASAKQGYAVALAAAKVADTSTGALAKASKGKPTGAGNYGKNASVSSGDFTVSIAAVGDPCSPPGTTTCDPQGKELPANNGTPVNPANPTNPANPVNNGNVANPANGAAPVSNGVAAADDDLLGGDKDDDGIPNAFDVNDDGDDIVDSADSTTPAPKAGVEDSTCSQVDFKIFTNFKATQPKFAGTINAYGPGSFEATKERIAQKITNTMTMVFSPISSVCGSNVTKTWLKGNGAPYAPTDFVDIGSPCSTGDYQLQVGAGKFCGSGIGAGNVTGTTFKEGGYTFTGSDLPTGQDTFTMKVDTADGKSYEFTSSPGFVFVTHPMMVSYSTDGTTYTNIDYTQTSSNPVDGVGLANEVTFNVGKTQTLYIKAYRPQRLAIDGETAAFYDLGGFKWTPDLPNGQVGKCDALTSTDSVMTTDQPVDTATKPTVTLQWAIGTKCYGVAPKNAAWQAGPSDVDIMVEPTGPGGNSAQKVRLNYTP